MAVSSLIFKHKRGTNPRSRPIAFYTYCTMPIFDVMCPDEHKLLTYTLTR